MARAPRLPTNKVVERIADRLARYDRRPFQDMLASAVATAPSKRAWRKLAERDPAKHAQAVAQLAKPAGFAERTESVSVSLTPKDLARELTARMGPLKAREVLATYGLPPELVELEEQRVGTPPREGDVV